MKKTRVPSWGQEDPMEKGRATHSILFPGEFHGQKSLLGYSPWDCKKLDMTEQLTLGKGNFGKSENFFKSQIRIIRMKSKAAKLRNQKPQL